MLAIGLLAAAPLWGCGMKGPPLAPFVRVPAAVDDLVVQRLGDEVSIGFTLPTANQDRSEPASLVRVDVYAMTTRPRLPPDRELELEEFQEAATLVASIEVAPPPEPEPEEAPAEEPPPAEPPPAEPPPAEPPPAAPPEDAPASQGAPVLLTEPLTAEIEAPVDPWEEERRLREEAQAEAEAAESDETEDLEEEERPVMAPLMTPPLPGPLQREYAVVQVSTRGDESEGGERIAVPLGIRAPEPPPAPEVVYGETTVEVTWDLPPGARETVQGPATAEAVAGDVEGVGAAAEAAAAPTSEQAPADEAPASDEALAPDEAPASDGAVAPDEAVASDEAPAADGTLASEVASGSDEAPPDAGADTPAEAAPADGGDETGALAGGGDETGAPADGGDETGAPADEADEAAGPEAPLTPLGSRPIVEWPPASTYELFEVAEPEAGSPAVPEPLSQSPLDAPSYTDPRVEYGVERCYAVRTIDIVAGFEVRSRLSPATCVTFVDTFPPAAPEALTAVGSQGEVSLLWRPSDEADLAGYVVLRGSPGDETLQPLMDAPIVENTYRDVTAAPGVRHVYAVRAVDTAANPSEPSDRVEAAAR